MKTTMYCAVRDNHGQPWIDSETISHTYQSAKYKAKKLDKRFMKSAIKFPLDRISRFELVECEDQSIREIF